MMATHGAVRGRVRLVAAALLCCLVASACSGGGRHNDARRTQTPPSPSVAGSCGPLTIAYDPGSGYEASAFIVGSLAKTQLGCDVQYVRTTSRDAWNLVAQGDADVYLDAFGNKDLRHQLAGPDGPVTVVGPNGIPGGVDLLAPQFMGDDGLDTATDLPDVQRIGWGTTTPAITTVPQLVRLAQSFVEFEQLDYVVRNTLEISQESGMRYLLPQPAVDNQRHQPNVYLAAAPLALLGDAPGRVSVPMPNSAATGCRPSAVTTLCSLRDFPYEKIVNHTFATSGSPAYTLVYNYLLRPQDVGTVEEIVKLSGYNVGPADVTSWLNTHQEAWRRWLPHSTS